METSKSKDGGYCHACKQTIDVGADTTVPVRGAPIYHSACAGTAMLVDLAREALAVQDACNLSGVVHGFSRAITRLREALPKAGTDEINTHPVCVLWSDKVAHLTGTQTFAENNAVTRAYKWAHDVTETPEEEDVAEEHDAPPHDAATATGMYDHDDQN